MCFYTVSDKPKKMPKFGWKVFDKFGKDLCFEFCCAKGSKVPRSQWIPVRNRVVPTNQWIIASDGPLFTDDHHYTYHMGFHCFTTKDSAKHWCGCEQVIRKGKYYRDDMPTQAISSTTLVG